MGEQYVRCAERLGVDAGSAQLTIDADGAPLSFNSTVDVPGEVHGPCFALVTNRPVSGVSSHGTERDVDKATLAANTYEVCVWSKGFDVGGAQAVFVNDSDVPAFMKTGAEVPARFHGPCFSELTGMPANGQSSWGR